MFKKISAAVLAALMIFAVGCGSETADDTSSVESTAPIVEKQEEKDTLFVNPLTGVAELKNEAKINQRPIAIMVNNVDIAQNKQTGLFGADIVYETEVEGGITRLMAVFQDVSDLEKIGTVRSARYPYVDLALGHNAIYVHCGQDPTYCAPHLSDIDDLDIGDGTYGAKKIPNGLNTEHTLYAFTNGLTDAIDKKFDTTAKSTGSWAAFTDKELSFETSATSITVSFPASKTRFTYDTQTGLYTRLLGSSVQTDYFTKDATQVKNVFVLLTSISNYPDGKHRKVDLQSGTGYYITNGTVKEIKWKKGAAKNGFKFTDANGEEIEVSAGNSWVCIANKSTCTPVFE